MPPGATCSVSLLPVAAFVAGSAPTCSGAAVPLGAACLWAVPTACNEALCTPSGWDVQPCGNTPPTAVCAGGTPPPCALEFHEDNVPAAHTQGTRVGFAAAGVVDMQAGLRGFDEDGQTVRAACSCGPQCEARLSSTTGDIVLLIDQDFNGALDVACTLSDDGMPQREVQFDALIRVVLLPVNDIPVASALTRRTTVAKTVAASPVTVQFVNSVAPGPSTAVDEVGQTVVATCEGPTDVFLPPGPTLSLTPTGNTFTGAVTLRVWNTAPSGIAQVNCHLTDSSNATLRLPPLEVDVVGSSSPAGLPGSRATHSVHADILRGTGAVLGFDTGYPLHPTDPIPFRVQDAAGTTSAVFPQGAAPLVTLTTDQGGVGLLPALLQGGQQGVRMAVRGGRVELTLAHAGYLLRSPDTETLDVAINASLLTIANADTACRDGCGGTIRVTGTTPRMPGAAELQSQRDGVVAGMALGSMLLPAQPSSGTKVGVVSFVAKAMECPGTGPDKLDRTLNPLGLRLGSGDYQDYNGAVVGSLIINAFLLLCCACAFCFFRSRDVAPSGSCPCPACSRQVLLTRARFGWLLLPFAFLYGGSSVGAVTAMLYSTLPFRLLGVCLFVFFVAGLPLYVYVMGRRSYTQTHCTPCVTKPTLVRKVFWGSLEWSPQGTHGAAWLKLHHLVFDSYREACRGFLVQEVLFVFVLSVLTAIQPETRSMCEVRAVAMAVLLGLYTVLLLARRPYAAIYDNVFEPLISGLEAAMMTFTIIAMKSDDPEDHWGAEAAAHLAAVVMWLILAKFLIDAVVFVIDEHAVWRENGGTGGPCAFAMYWFFLVNASDTRSQGSCDKSSDLEICMLGEDRLTQDNDPEECMSSNNNPEWPWDSSPQGPDSDLTRSLEEVKWGNRSPSVVSLSQTLPDVSPLAAGRGAKRVRSRVLTASGASRYSARPKLARSPAAEPQQSHTLVPPGQVGLHYL